MNQRCTDTHTKCNSWWLHDAKGIPLARVCVECEAQVRDRYSPEVLGERGAYEDMVDEQIEEVW
jgi:hypothetical protein